VHGIEVVRFAAGDAATEPYRRRRRDRRARPAAGHPHAPTACRCCSAPRTAAKSAPRTPAGRACPRACSKPRCGRCARRRRAAGLDRPGAGPQRYEVGENVHAAFVGRDAGAAAHFVPTRPGHWLADLPALRAGASPRPAFSAYSAAASARSRIPGAGISIAATARPGAWPA
jgi:hypothetical protein